MTSIVRIALQRPYTFVVMALLLAISGVFAALRTPADILPEIRIPVLAVVWQYTGLSPDEMAGRITTVHQRMLTTTVNDIEHLEATSFAGVGLVRIFFHPEVDIATANAQVGANTQVAARNMPAGTNAPLMMNYNASTVPILQVALSGKGLTEQNLADLGFNVIRTRLITVPGAAVPLPFGGKSRQIQIDIDPTALQARGLSAQDVATALAAQNVIVPVGTQKIGASEYAMHLNNAPAQLEDIANLPVKSANGTVVYLRDVATVRDGSPPQTNIVRVDGGRSVLMSVLKNGATSTLDIVSGVKARLREIAPSLPPNLEIRTLNDQSLFVRAAIRSVVIEGLVAALLTSLMILLFLGSLRSTLIIAISIPLAVAGAMAALSATGETFNIMTLGGLALAVGLLVDDATVTVENINWHLEQGKAVATAIMDGAAQIVTPAFVSLLAICIVFVPMFFLEGVPGFLFVPMAKAVVFAMLTSFVLSRTLVPTMANRMLHAHAPGPEHGSARSLLGRLQQGFQDAFERMRRAYRDVLLLAMQHRGPVIGAFAATVVASAGLLPFLGSNFFPDVDGGQILMHVRVPVGTRVEETAARFARVEERIRQLIPARDVETVVSNIGVPMSSINLIYNNTGLIGSQDGDIQVALAPGHQPSARYVRLLREVLPREFPGSTFSFPPADIVGQTLNFGAPAPIEVQIRGGKLDEAFDYAGTLLARLREVPGIADARIQQSQRYPVFDIDVDRTRAQLAGLTSRDVTNSLVVALAGSSQVAPTNWLNPGNGVSYPIVMQAPQYRLDSLQALSNLPLGGAGSEAPQTLGALASVRRAGGNAVVSQYDLQTVVQIRASLHDRDLGGVARHIRRLIAGTADQAPRGAQVELMGQARMMDSAFSGLLWGLAGAIVLIYLLIVVNFQSWSDPLVIVAALPMALAGIVWMLFMSWTPLSVPALTGAIMCMGIATANSVLVISFARERLAAGVDAVRAAVEAGHVRLRPVLMTALAMIIGMTPMALGLGEGGEQNAPLGRAVIGGLLAATLTTLVFVPVAFSLAHGARRGPAAGPSGASHVA
jgi:CzcA family heavy metal efflux pump